MKRQLALLVVTALTGLSLAQADPHHPNPAPAQSQNAAPLQALPMPGGTAQMPTGPQGTMPMAQMMQMMQGMMGQMGQMGQMGMMGMMGSGLMMLEGAPFEQAFLSMMVPHHRAAVTMARDVLGKTQDAQIRGWANAIIRDQEREIAQMRTLLGALGGTNLAAQRMMTQGTGGMGNMGAMMMGQGAGGMMQSPPTGGMMQNPATGDMAQAPQTPLSPERAFIQAMIPHHLQAIEMATLALQKAQNPVIVKLASDIVRTQAQEVYQMRLKLAGLR